MKDDTALAEGAIPQIKVAQQPRPGSWYTKLVRQRLSRNASRIAALPAALALDPPAARARTAIRWATVKSAISGAFAGAVTTGAAVVTVETDGAAGVVAGPVAALAIGGEMMVRTIVHVDLYCQIAHIFGVKLDPGDDRDLFRILWLASRAYRRGQGPGDTGRDLVAALTMLDRDEAGAKIGQRVLGESVLRNIVPVLGIVASAVVNAWVTRRLGDTARRTLRCQSALAAGVSAEQHDHLDLLIEGIWFIFCADGKLSPEEAGLLAHMLGKLDPLRRRATLARFVEDELDWTRRIADEVPEPLRDGFMHLLETAAATRGEPGFCERKILRRAALALGRDLDWERVLRMSRELEETGLISKPG